MKMPLSGKKQTIITVGVVVASAVGLFTGQDVSQWLDLALRALGLTDPDTIAEIKAIATQLAPLLAGMLAAGHGLWKMRQQKKAGATVAELGSPAGVIKAALSAGEIVDANTGQPMADVRAVAAAVPVQVAAKPLVVVEAVAK